jgi:hypothetical protein
MQAAPPPLNWVARLRGFVQKPVQPERCELCSAPIGPDHPHLIEPAERRLLCACRGCALLFSGSASRRYREVPNSAEVLHGFAISDAAWEALRVPIGLAFFFRSSVDDRIVGIYPGPAGATESQLGLSAWHALAADNPVLNEMEPDVEALLVNRIDGVREYYRVPIDRCYALIGTLRRHWRGFSGGAEGREAIREFCASLHGAGANRVAWHA